MTGATDPALAAIVARLSRAQLAGGVRLVPARVEDVERVWAIRRAAYRELAVRQYGRWDDAALRARFDAKWDPAAALLVVRDGEDVGAIELDGAAAPGAVFVRSIALLEAAQGAGLGTALLRALRAAAGGEGRAVALSVVHANARAAALYARLGFVVERADDERTWMRWP